LHTVQSISRNCMCSCRFASCSSSSSSSAWTQVRGISRH
jgi:hypothetical protein